MNAALITELSKFYRSTVARATAVIMVLGIALICSSMLLAAGTTDPQIAAKLGPIIDPGGWVGYLGAAAQVTSAAALLGFGVLISWAFGREFGDGTITGLFALPVTRPTIALAKLVVYAIWAVAASLALALALILFGFVFGLGQVTTDALPALGRQIVLTMLTATLAVPAAWIATLGRSVLAGIGTTVVVLVLSQVAVIAGAGGWFTPAAPALWAVSGGTRATPMQLTLVAPLLAISCGLTLLAWRRLQLDR